MKVQTIFERTEIKYIISLRQREALLKMIEAYIKTDEYGESTVCSLYFDTDDFLLIRNSMDKPVYKEKLRLRSYSTPKANSSVFLELKKKYRGVVYKRRQTLRYIEAMDYIDYGEMPDESQIMREIDYTMSRYRNLRPRMFIGYARTAFYSRTDHELRITFDKNVRFRTDNLDLAKGSYGETILPSNLCIMEIKSLNTMPLWLTSALSRLKLFPGSFSKYGTAYRIVSERNHQTTQETGGMYCA